MFSFFSKIPNSLEYETDKIQKAYCDDLSNEGMDISLEEATKYYEKKLFNIAAKDYRKYKYLTDRTFNFYLENDSFYLVDVPGYGYAKCSKDGRDRIKKVIEGYILNRESMTLLFVLIDSRHEPQRVDTEFMAWLGENGVPFSIIFTKADKLGKTKIESNINSYRRKLLEQWEELPPMFVTSSEDKRGRVELLEYILEINNSL